MKKIESFEARAPKINGDGDITYHLWVSDSGELHVQMVKNNIETTKPGTLNSNLFPVSKYLDRFELDSKMNITDEISSESFEPVAFKDNNPSAFLKAVLRHMFTK
ncbi:hypothetical protein RB977_002564 [Vibrio harveyi]|nr:hypothetical protein [Vibrio parahaemolyticus]ELE7133125.1 hypothetical protein [Vibrio harveyi]